MPVPTIRFPVRGAFHARVKRRVHQYFADNGLPTTGDWRLFLKTGLILTQIEHHLFPAICHVHYLALSTIVRQTCHDFAIPYVCYPTIRAALGGHYRWLKTLGRDGGPRPTLAAAQPHGGEGPDAARRAGVSTSRLASE